MLSKLTLSCLNKLSRVGGGGGGWLEILGIRLSQLPTKLKLKLKLKLSLAIAHFLSILPDFTHNI